MNEVDATSPPPPPPPDTRGNGVSFILWSEGCCLRGASHSTSAFSDGDLFNALADGDFDLLQLIEEERAELVAVVNQEGNDTTHTTGKSIFHVYFSHLKTSYVDWGKRFRIKLYVMGLKSSTPYACDLQ